MTSTHRLVSCFIFSRWFFADWVGSPTTFAPMRSATSVSYTHLDVYKRQDPHLNGILNRSSKVSILVFPVTDLKLDRVIAGFRLFPHRHAERNCHRLIRVHTVSYTHLFEADSIQKNEAYVGNIEPGKSGNVDTMINGIAPTTDDGKVKLSITYEDENGKVSTVEKEIQLMVNEDQSMDESNVDDTWNSDDVQPRCV